MADTSLPIAQPPVDAVVSPVASNAIAGVHVQQFQQVGPNREHFPYPTVTPNAPAPAVVGAASAELVAANAARKGLTITNLSANWVFLGFGHPAVLNGGCALAPGGGTYNMTPFDYNKLVVNAIASAAGSNVAVQEYQ